ncbi:MAG: hypothetical protein DRP63_00930 [Planctomycetota bacterium]|nr:MAG: hypothetical protein DRP63_00930 [Planctomycetota bacterium]
MRWVCALCLVFLFLGCHSPRKEEEVIVARVAQVEKEEFKIRTLGLHSVEPAPDDLYVEKGGVAVPLRLMPDVEARRKVLGGMVDATLRQRLREVMGDAFKEGAKWMLYVERLEWGKDQGDVCWLELEASVRDYEGRTPLHRKVRRQWRKRGGESEEFIYESLAVEAARALVDALPIAPPLPAELTDMASSAP